MPEQLLHLAEVRAGAEELRWARSPTPDLPELGVVERLPPEADARRRSIEPLRRDRLALIALVTTGLRRSELCGLDWRDLDAPSLLVRRGKGGKPRRQPLPAGLAGELRTLRTERAASPEAPVFCGLHGRHLQQTTLAAIIQRASARAGLEKHVTAHTLRHTAATWLRQEFGDTRLVAEYLGHADLSTVSRYAHVAREELFAAAGRLEVRARGVDLHEVQQA